MYTQHHWKQHIVMHESIAFIYLRGLTSDLPISPGLKWLLLNAFILVASGS